MTASNTGSVEIEAGELQPSGGWMSPPAQRLIPPKPADRGFFFRAISLGARLFGRKQLPDIFPVFHINSRLFWAWLFFASRLMPGGRLRSREREKIILRTAWNCRSRYEWGQHVDIALAVGVTDEEIVWVARGPEAWVDQNGRALMLACDEIYRDNCISEPTWVQLSKGYNEKLLIEILILIGHYVMVAGSLNSAGLRLEAPIEEKLQAFHQRVAGRISTS